MENGPMIMSSRNRRGFTLIELLIVVAVIGIIATLVILQISYYKVRANNASAVSDLKAFKVSLEAYYVDQKTYP
jgi:prepilin-type N-terminal cleavage/methylation domain-containing protein